MFTHEIYSIDVADLPIGASLPFDLCDESGAVVHLSGLPITSQLHSRLAKLGVRTITIRGVQGNSISSEVPLASPIPAATVAEINQRLDKTTVQLSKAYDSLLVGQRVDTNMVRGCLRGFAPLLREETSGILHVIMERNLQSSLELEERLAESASRLAILSMLAASSLMWPANDIVNIGIAASFSNVSYFLHPDWFDEECRLKNEILESELFLEHSVESAQLLAKTTSFDPDVIESISQLEEYCDGSGYPYMLEGHAIDPKSKVIQLADIFLSLADPCQRSIPFFESDVVCYLIHHSNRGKFDPNIVRAMVRTMTVFPVGAIVKLSDGALAQVVHSNGDAPFKPTVRTLESQSRSIDLDSSALSIVGPAATNSNRRMRIDKSMIDQELWRGTSNILHRVG